jgi:hypothetical protein
MEVCSLDQCCLAAAVDESGERGPLEWCRLSVGRRQAWCAYCFTPLLSGRLIYSLLVRTTGLLLDLSEQLACSFAADRMNDLVGVTTLLFIASQRMTEVL